VTASASWRQARADGYVKTELRAYRDDQSRPDIGVSGVEKRTTTPPRLNRLETVCTPDSDHPQPGRVDRQRRPSAQAPSAPAGLSHRHRRRDDV